MDWNRAIERNTEAFAAIVVSLTALFEIAGGAARISRSLHRSVLRVLLPAEAAVRRLIVIAARGLTAKPHRPRPAPAFPIGRSGSRFPSFRLFDPRQNYSVEPRAAAPRLAPRLHVFANDPRVAAWWPKPEPATAPAPVTDDGLVGVLRLSRRLEALRLALSDVPRQARRLVRLRARRAADPNLSWRSPLRPGPPPGSRKHAILDVDFVLRECHALAWDALKPDTS